jgi:uncharacterized protein (DUF1810 family)
MRVTDNPESPDRGSDPFNLSRFLEAQNGVYERALGELRRGRKTSHWMWFIFPQIAGLGYSSTARHYAIKNMDEARAYLQHPVLGARLVECCETILKIRGNSASNILGYPDDLKLRSCVTLFSLAKNGDDVFSRVLGQYFDGEPDQRTIEILQIGHQGPGWRF